MRPVTSVVGICLSVVLPLYAQENTPADTAHRRTMGVGVAMNTTTLLIDDFGFAPFGTGNLLFPIRVTPRVTIEPEFGIFRSSSEDGGFSQSFSSTRLGVGLLLEFPERAGLTPYIGPRIGWSRLSSESSGGGGTSRSKQSAWQFAGVLGAQHFFTPQFSLGGEIQLSRTGLGAEETTPPIPSSETSSFVTTVGLAILRWFF